MEIFKNSMSCTISIVPNLPFPFKKAKKMLKHVADGQYQGKPVIIFGAEETVTPGAFTNFTFGSAKAARLVQAIAANGVGPIVQKLVDLAGDKISAEERQAVEQELVG